MNALLLATLLYSALMAAALPTITPRVFEPASSRPDALRATWAAAALLPLTPLNPPVGLAALLASAYAALRGRRVTAALIAAAYILYVSIVHMVCT